MAEAIGAAIISSAFGVSASVSTAVGIAGVSAASIVGGVTIAGGLLGLQLLVGSQQPKQKIAAQQLSLRQALPSRTIWFGRNLRAGPKFMWDAAGGKFFDGYYLGEGPIDAFEEVQLDGKITPITFPGGIATIAPWGNAVAVELRVGNVPEPTFDTLVSGLSYWTDAHRLDGCATALVTSTAPKKEKFNQVFPGGRPPEALFRTRDLKVRDVRDPGQTEDPATWVWSDRAGPCIYTFLNHGFGTRVPFSLLNTASWQAFNALCDETIHDKNGVAFPRYYLAGCHRAAEDEPADTLQQMLDACDGRLTLEPDGTIGVTGGKFPAVTLTFGDAGVISRKIIKGSSKLAAFNRLKISYLSPPHGYQQIEGDPWVDPDYPWADDAAELLETTFDRPWVQNHNQLRRLAKIYTAKKNPAWRLLGMVTDLSWAPCLFEEAVRIKSDRYGFDEVFIVERAVANIEAGTCTFDFASLRSDTYDFNAETEEGTTPAVPASPNSVLAATPPDPPESLVMLVERRVVAGGTSAVFLRLIAAEPAREDLSLIGRYRRVGDTAWLNMAQEGENRASLISSVLADGEVYEAEGALATYGAALQSDWTEPDPATIVAVADGTPPDQPTAFGVEAIGSLVTVVWINSGSANIADVQVRRATGSGAAYSSSTIVGTLAGAPNQSMVFSESLAAGTYRYWLVARNASGTAAAPLGPATVTVA
ncbi:hypothetical protein [Enterovirga aerilata]|uniref:Tip attachment protein J domain-containing protein n=1 Tax=Enterovirga aerilata TaxID=2730920 RepID=A0A849IFY1_9HYPH|nr:hypothetical protein [Enterovirga sp. DB1703]NNM75070.1 hypothetical protein [Enterovirga sp. DB1703]